MGGPERLRIVHVVRSPIGGIFRHIVDLATAQSSVGHDVGIVCDANTGGVFESEAIARVARKLSLGVARIPMQRSVSPGDVATMRRVLAQLRALAPDVVHTHGAKAGIYGRLVGTWLGRKRPVARLYAPHGGSLHFDPDSLEGRVYFMIERALERASDALVHVSAYEAETYRRKVGEPRCRTAVILNGLRQDEYEPCYPDVDASDLIFMGMLRDLKGADVFIEAIGLLRSRYGRTATAQMFGQVETPDLARYQALARAAGIERQIIIHPPRPTREAFQRGRVIIVPSRAESMPYIVLEAIAASLPIVATRVGGIPEIFGPHSAALVPPADVEALAAAMDRMLADPIRAGQEADARRAWIAPRFNIDTMRRQVDALYRDILEEKRGSRPQ